MNNTNGLTLVELLVASMISMFVLMGLFTVMNSMQTTNFSAGNNSYIDSSVRSMVADIIRSASTAVGTATSPGFIKFSNGGAVSGSPVVNGDTFCFTQDSNGNDGELKDNLDEWVCYSRLSDKLYQCRSFYISDISVSANRGAAACTVNNTFLGGVKEIIFVTPEFNTVGGERVFRISIKSLNDPSQNASIKNKQVTYTQDTVMGGQSYL